MNSDHFVKVFNVLDSGFKDWTFSAFGLIPLVFGLFFFFIPRIIKKIGISFFDFHDFQSKFRKFFLYFYLGFATLWISIAFFSTYAEHQHHAALAESNQCRTVEGRVKNFIPMPFSGHAEESFSVSGVHFSYSDYQVTDGFNNTASHGGPINRNSYARICYDPSGNVILRLEIRGFKGRVKDYSKEENLFSMPRTAKVIQKNNARIFTHKIPWYGNMFTIFYILDFIALVTLFLPYLRTYFYIKAMPIDPIVIPVAIEFGKKINLRNSVIYWDKEDRTIWLRPRGLNLFQIQLMVAKLNLDEFGRSITSQEIRFSSGFPFIMILFFWTTYQFFSATMPVHGPSPTVFVGGFTLFFIVFGFMSIIALRSRMEKLVQDALSELKEM